MGNRTRPRGKPTAKIHDRRQLTTTLKLSGGPGALTQEGSAQYHLRGRPCNPCTAGYYLGSDPRDARADGQYDAERATVRMYTVNTIDHRGGRNYR